MSTEYTLYNHARKEYLELGKRYGNPDLPAFQRVEELLKYLKNIEISGSVKLEIVSDISDDELLKDEYLEIFPEGDD